MRLATALLVLGLLAACRGKSEPEEAGPRLDERLALGEAHSCVVLPDGRVACWGEGNGGELGGDEDSAGPRAVAGIEDASRIRAAEAGGCALDGDAVKCWGAPLHGEEVSGPGVRVVRAAAPAHFAVGPEVCWDDELAIRCFDRTIGAVSEQSPLGFIQGRLCRVGAVGVECEFRRPGFTPVPGTEGAILFNEHVFVNAAGELRRLENSGTAFDGVAVLGPAVPSEHVCVIREDGLVYCRGSNRYGQLGRETTGGGWGPVAGIEDARAVATGADHSCALTAEGVWCWGRNHQGQLGDGGTSNSAVPVRVIGLNFRGEPLLVEAAPGPRCLLQDRDGDGIPDEVEGEFDPDDDGVVSADDDDSDGDGLLDRDEWALDACGEPRRPGCENTSQRVDSDFDGVPDAQEESVEARCDRDSDDDGCIDLAEALDRCGPFDISLHLPGAPWIALVPGPSVPGELSLVLQGLDLAYEVWLDQSGDEVQVHLEVRHPMEGHDPFEALSSEVRHGEVLYLNDGEPWARGHVTVVLSPFLDLGP